MSQANRFKTALENSAADHLKEFDSLQAIRAKVAQHLSLIGKRRTFKNYTDHGIDHADRMLSLMEEMLLPPQVHEMILKDADECILLVLGTYLHDIGMFIPSAEEEAVLTGVQSWWPDVQGTLFPAFRDEFVVLHRDNIIAAGLDPNNLPEQYVESVVLDEFFRKYHPQRANSLWQKSDKVEFKLDSRTGHRYNCDVSNLTGGHIDGHGKIQDSNSGKLLDRDKQPAQRAGPPLLPEAQRHPRKAQF